MSEASGYPVSKCGLRVWLCKSQIGILPAGNRHSRRESTTRLDFRVPAQENAGVARVVFEHVTKDFPVPNGESVRAVSDLGLTIEDGELLVVVGPSGCGKTTTLRLLAGLDEPTAGTISIDGNVMNGTLPKERDLAMVFQNPALYPHLSVYDNLAFGLKVRKYSKAEIAGRVAEAAQMLGLGDCLQRLPMALSGGQRQRVALGRAVVRRPALLLFDEPLSNLDPHTRYQLRSQLVSLHRQLESTMLYVTHDQAEAMMLGDRVGVMRAGGLQQVDKPLELYRHPANLFVAGFIGSPPMNFFTGRLVADAGAVYFESMPGGGAQSEESIKLRLQDDASGKLQSYAGRTVVLGIRPEHINLAAAQPSLSHEEAVTAIVESTETTGPDSFLRVICCGRPLATRVNEGERRSPGEKVVLGFDMRRVRFFDPATEQAVPGL